MGDKQCFREWRPYVCHSSTCAFPPGGDQPDSIRQLTEGILNGEQYQTLLGITGSSKTFPVINVRQHVQRPTFQ